MEVSLLAQGFRIDGINNCVWGGVVYWSIVGTSRRPAPA